MQRTSKAPRRPPAPPKPPAPGPLRWDDVQLFLAVCRGRTVGRAATALGVDASTISRRLDALEAAMATTLFDRGRGGATATEAAEALLPVAEEMEQAMLRFAGAAAGLEREAAGLVRLTCPPDMADVVVAPLLRELRARHPGLRVALDPGESLLDLTRREADIALRTVRPERGDLIVTRVATVRWVLVASPGLARAVGTLRSWDDVSWVSWSERRASLGPARWLARHARGVEPAVLSDSLRVQLAVVAAGVGVALVPEASVEHFRLAPLPLAPSLRAAASEWPVDDLFLVTHRALRDVPRVRAVWELLLERLGEPTRAARR
jgi:DNA-binding transcriptional LysR family regulator